METWWVGRHQHFQKYVSRLSFCLLISHWPKQVTAQKSKVGARGVRDMSSPGKAEWRRLRCQRTIWFSTTSFVICDEYVNESKASDSQLKTKWQFTMVWAVLVPKNLYWSPIPSMGTIETGSVMRLSQLTHQDRSLIQQIWYSFKKTRIRRPHKPMTQWPCEDMGAKVAAHKSTEEW